MDYSNIKHFELRRKFWKIAGAEIYISDPTTSQEVGYIKMKAWKLREDVRIFAGRDMQRELVQIHARQIIDFGATYDVTNSVTGQPMAALRRKGLKSTFVRDHWDIYDSAGNTIGSVQETSGMLAIVRRWIEIIPYVNLLGIIFSFIAQTYVISMKQADGSDAVAARIVHRKNPFIVKMDVDMTDAQVAADPLIVLAASAMLSVVDAAKNS
ncbi:MAG TPA: hypothetical protein VLF59_00300 [Candidatus Saccharimonadales bacterium]|nr:hypothetical protein [Candidatus Saccharimonadales bacterium]